MGFIIGRNLVQHIRTVQSNTSYQQNEVKKKHNHLTDTKSTWQKSTPFMIKTQQAQKEARAT